MALKPEESLQIAIVSYFKMQYPKFKDNLFHVANEGKRTAYYARKMADMGLLHGVSDLILVLDKVYFIELKTPKGRLSPYQKNFQSMCLNQGHSYKVIRSVQEFTAFCNYIFKSH